MVTRGGFHVGNGINWKGQIFSKMHNYTMTNRMTVCPIILSLIFLLDFEIYQDKVFAPRVFKEVGHS